MSGPYDVVLVGEILVELYCLEPLAAGAAVRLGFSGDTLNAAAAAAAAGARVAVLTAVGDDELGDALVARAADLGVDTALIQRRPAPNGAYLLHGDMTGQREFSYWRTASAASGLDATDTARCAGVLGSARAVLLSGICAALSDGCELATLTAAWIADQGGAQVVYDPNFRARLTAPARASRVLAAIAPHCALVTPSCPADAVALAGTADPHRAARAILGLGARAVAVTRGAEPILAATPDREFAVPVPANPGAVDSTGAGDVLVGTAAARLALGDTLTEALRLGAGAASLSVAGHGGTGLIPSLAATRAAAPPAATGW